MAGRSLLWVLLLTSQLTLVFSDGVIQLLFKEYVNPGGGLENGHCCDGKYFLCQSNGCDHMFSICLDHAAGSDDMRSCRYGERMSDKLSDQDVNIFGPDINGLANPMSFDVVGEIPISVTLKVTVMDKDRGNFWQGQNDLVEALQGDADVSNAPRGEEDAPLQTLSGRTSLYYSLWFSCNTHWYGPRCGVNCRPPTSGQHYRCDEATGEKICLPVYTGENCDRSVNLTTRPTHPTWPTTPTHPTRPTRPTMWTSPTSPTSPSYITWWARPTSVGSTTPRLPPNADCDEIAKAGYANRDGVYTIEVPGLPPFRAYCEMSDKGWTVIQRRVNGDVDFNRGWSDYQTGFGDVGVDTNYWMGLERMHSLTTQRSYRLVIIMVTRNLEFSYANYEQFHVGDLHSNYTLTVSGFSGNAGDSLGFTGLNGTRLHDGMPFSTQDRDNDQSSINCAYRYKSGWWFNNCLWSNLNGEHIAATSGSPRCYGRSCITWLSIPNDQRHSLVYTEMRVLPNPRSD